MQQAIPHGGGSAWGPLSPPPDASPSCSAAAAGGGGGEGLKRMVAENPVLVVGRRGCCMCHVVKRLLLGLGVNPAVCEVGDEIDDVALMEDLAGGDSRKAVLFPAVFIGGRLVGGIDRLMAVHISGDLVPILKEAGALWL